VLNVEGELLQAWHRSECLLTKCIVSNHCRSRPGKTICLMDRGQQLVTQRNCDRQRCQVRNRRKTNPASIAAHISDCNMTSCLKTITGGTLDPESTASFTCRGKICSAHKSRKLTIGMTMHGGPASVPHQVPATWSHQRGCSLL
jgi:hypothetical protein